jgi:pimeloyl-ACP methyl ester carboxylesterase
MTVRHDALTLCLLAALGGATLAAKHAPARTGEVLSPDGIRIRYDVRGAGPAALVFVHGWSCDRTYWKDQVDHFARSYQVVALDLAGHGESGLGRKAYTMPAFGDDVVAVVEKLGLGRVVLIGHSMGGDVIVPAANRMPDRVRGLVWVDTYATLGKPRTREQLDAFLAPLRADFAKGAGQVIRRMFLPGTDPALVERVVADMTAAPPAVALDAVEHALTYDRHIVRGLKTLKAPVVAINADYRPTDVAALERHGVKVVPVKGVGHFLMMERPERFNRVLGEVVEGFVRSSASD